MNITHPLADVLKASKNLHRIEVWPTEVREGASVIDLVLTTTVPYTVPRGKGTHVAIERDRLKLLTGPQGDGLYYGDTEILATRDFSLNGYDTNSAEGRKRAREYVRRKLSKLDDKKTDQKGSESNGCDEQVALDSGVGTGHFLQIATTRLLPD